ncbi:thioredoxin-like protein HCF164 chloroplastic-like protein [Trifolium pratense]|uniref:Thioredoxin-like protein HCF164, chloroplastic n=1 Tax=Trifolium pratense TaxID=57577 RepID=A0A2K3PKC8_TRIPR|nr:thioredoxin-like protein HCF164, chloroplastic [Trifolium pratense]PNY15730.1 thioredoxin-like protein HCF164 chloroplastic-like protein [Trifolium pratense]
MARLSINPIGLQLHRFQPCFQPSHSTVYPRHHRRSRFHTLSCQTDPNLNKNDEITSSSTTPQEIKVVVETSKETTSSSVDHSTALPQLPNKDVSRKVAIASTLAALGLFVFTRLDFGVSLKDLSAVALPYEQALSNGKPTVVEFYADWCEVCRELAPDVYKIEQQYKNRVNFVMLNVDNTNWEQELDEFGVEGIPHFAFLDKKGNEEGNVVGRLPRQYLLENVDALARGEAQIPHARVVGQYSSAEARKVHQVVDPRSHG